MARLSAMVAMNAHRSQLLVSGLTIGLALIMFSRAFGTYFGADDFRLIVSADSRGLFLPGLMDRPQVRNCRRGLPRGIPGGQTPT
jgi:hypothetical protein